VDPDQDHYHQRHDNRLHNFVVNPVERQTSQYSLAEATKHVIIVKKKSTAAITAKLTVNVYLMSMLRCDLVDDAGKS